MSDLTTPFKPEDDAVLLKDLLAHLLAAVSLLERGGKRAAASDKMFDQMLLDYKASVERGRAALARFSCRQPDAGYRAGMLRAAEDVLIHYSMGWELDGVMITLKKEYDADVQAPQPNAVPEPVVWQIKTKKSGWWSNTDALTFKTCSERPDVWDVRPLYATPPASVPAGEVTERVDAERYRALRTRGVAPAGTMHLEERLVYVATNLDAWVDALLKDGRGIAPSYAAEGLTAAQPSTDAGDVTEATILSELGFPNNSTIESAAKWFLGNLTHYNDGRAFEDSDRKKVADLLRAALAARGARS